MAKSLSKSGITTGDTVRARHVTQSIDAFTGIEAYDIILSGSLKMTGSITGQPNILNSFSASYALTASHALNGGGGGGTPGGSDTQVQFNDGGSFGGDSGFTFNKSTNAITNISEITASSHISSSAGNIYGLRGFFSGYINTPSISAGINSATLTIAGNAKFSRSITSSQNISSSKTIIGKTGSFSHLIGNSPITVGDQVTFQQPITASGNISSSGNLTALDLNLFGGDIDLKNAGAQSNIKFYCESANAHYTKLQAAPHSAYSGNPTLTLSAYDFDFAAPNFQANVTASTFNGNGSALTNLQRPISNSVSTNFTASNLNSGFYFRAGGNVTCSIQSSSLVTCNVGSEFEIIQTSSAGYVSFLTGSGVTLNSKSAKLKLAGQFSAVTLKKVGSNPDTWDLIGDLG
tara:strand:- start:1909 stop:3123 length:1215 start_codon:yes stop_codon:yes gene_type:complete